jgi:hypothetical protein
VLQCLRPNRAALLLASLAVSFILGCADAVAPDANVHGSTGGVSAGHASTVQVSPPSATVEEGANAPLSCSAQDARGLVLSVAPAWTTSDPNVATVAANGAVTARGVGSANITCAVDGRMASSVVTVTASPVAFIEVTPGAGTLAVGGSIQLSGVPRDASGATVPGHDVEWVSADTAVAVVSSSGTVVARVEGIASVIAMSGGKASLARISVGNKPVEPVASVVVTIDVSTLNVGKAGHASVSLFDASGKALTGRSVTWSVSDPKVLSVASTAAQKALVTPLAGGSAVVTATCEGLSGSTRVTVASSSQTVIPPTVQTVAVTLAAPTILPGQATAATAVVSDASGNILTGSTVTWSSLDPLIATVGADGTVTGVATGAVIIRATSGGKTGDATLTVSVPPVATVAVSLASSSLSLNQSTQASAVARDAGGHVLTGRTVAWSSLSPSTATVSIAGVVTAVSYGTADIRATVESQTGDATLNAGATVATVTVSLVSNALNVGQTTQATAVARDAAGAILTGRSVTWTALTPNLATISSSGLVSAVAAGPASVRATVDGTTADATLTVATPTATVASVVVTLDHSTIPVGQPAQAQAVAKDAAGNVITGKAVGWTSMTPSVALVSSTGVVTTIANGTATIRATVDTKTGDGVLTVTQQTTTNPLGTATDPAAPKLLVTTVASTPSAGRTLRVAASGNLQRALDTAVAGDRILLAAGATFVGNFVMGAKGGTGIPGGWITVQSDGALPAEGTRMTASSAATYNLPKLATATVSPVLSTAFGAARWRVIGVEMTNDPSALFNYGLVLLGDGTSAQNNPATIARNIILDRVYVHGTTTSDSRRCIALNSDSTAVIDSYVSECHSNGFDTQAVWGWNGNGPYKIVNNYLEASTEVAGFGGADPAISGLVPSDIEIRGNHITRPMAWKANNNWLEKNLIELKNARRVMIEGNVLENSWPQAQIGWAFVLFSVNQNGTCAWCVVQDVNIRNNLIRNVAAGFSLSDMYHGAGSLDATPANHISITNNLMIGVDNAAVYGGGYAFQINRVIASLHIEHNTGFVPSISAFQWNIPSPSPDFIIRNNLTGGARYSLFASPTNTWSSMAGAGSEFSGNVVATADGTNFVPAMNGYPSTLDGVGLAGGSSVAFSPTASPSSLGLSSTSPYKGKGTDGADPGANIATILAVTAGVVIP